MDTHFETLISSLEPAFQRLVAMGPVKVPDLPPPIQVPRKGIYLFSERSHHLYVGRSNNIRARLQQHCRASATHNSAPFAFRLARKTTGKKKASYMPSGSRADLERDPKFQKAFNEAKSRIRQMDVRYVEQGDRLSQALLEIYAAVALNTPHNDFDTH